MAPGARSKLGAPMFEPEFFRKHMYCIKESTCDIVETFRRPPAVIRHPRNCASLAPLVRPLLIRTIKNGKDFVAMSSGTPKMTLDTKLWFMKVL